jgi:hypothetical protein
MKQLYLAQVETDQIDVVATQHLGYLRGKPTALSQTVNSNSNAKHIIATGLVFFSTENE